MTDQANRSAYWRGVYESAFEGPHGTTRTVCPMCGAKVHDRSVHVRWHADLQAWMEMVNAASEAKP